MYVSFLCVTGIHKSVDCFSIHFEFLDPVSPVIFKSAFLFSHLTAYKILYSFHHNDKGKSTAVHVVKIIFAKISPVQDKPDIFITIAFYLINHKL